MDEKTNKFDEFQALEAVKKDGKYVLRLFVAGINPKSKKAIENLREVCEEELKGQYELRNHRYLSTTHICQRRPDNSRTYINQRITSTNYEGLLEIYLININYC